MHNNRLTPHKQEIIFPSLPLAVYREIAAHLRQVRGINTELIPQQSSEFNYQQSQVSSLWIEYTADAPQDAQSLVEDILNYYAQIYGVVKSL